MITANLTDKNRLIKNLCEEGIYVTWGTFIHEGVLYGAKSYHCTTVSFFAYGWMEHMNPIEFRNVVKASLELERQEKVYIMFVPNTWLFNYIDPELKMVKNERTGREMPLEEVFGNVNYMQPPDILL